MVAGAANGMATIVLGFPLDTIKTRMQLNMFPSMSVCARVTFCREGFRGFYTGVSTPFIAHVLKRSYQWPVFEYLNKKMSLSPLASGVIATGSGLFVAVLATPLQVLKVNAQASTNKDNIFRIARRVYQDVGFFGLYRGVAPTMMKDAIFGGCFLTTYGTLRKHIDERNKLQVFVAGVSSHCLSWTLFSPIDFLKTQVQNHPENRATMRSVLRNTLLNDGPLVMWRGLVPMCIRTFPIAGIGMVTYEKVKYWIH